MDQNGDRSINYFIKSINFGPYFKRQNFCDDLQKGRDKLNTFSDSSALFWSVRETEERENQNKENFEINLVLKT